VGPRLKYDGLLHACPWHLLLRGCDADIRLRDVNARSPALMPAAVASGVALGYLAARLFPSWLLLGPHLKPAGQRPVLLQRNEYHDGWHDGRLSPDRMAAGTVTVQDALCQSRRRQLLFRRRDTDRRLRGASSLATQMPYAAASGVQPGRPRDRIHRPLGGPVGL
jgi:hypothetical protein